MPGTFESPIILVRKKSSSVRVTVPEGIARALGAEPGGTLIWSLDLKAGRVTVSAEPAETAGKKASKRN